MPDTIIENPILNSPFREPNRHFRFSDEGITNEIVESRRASAYFVPIPPPKKKGKQLEFDTQWTQDRIQPNDQVNRVRERVKLWREGDYQGVTQVTRKLLQHWTDPDRENKLFFCQVEALETLMGEQPTYRYLWPRIRESLPRKGRRTEAVGGEPKLPVELQGALHSLYGNYEARYRQWQQSTAEANGAANQTPPVFIVVCNNTNVSKLVFDYIGGWERTLANGSTALVPGQLPLFTNVDDGRWKARPVTILIDSEQLESGDAMSAEFKQIASLEIDEYKSEYRARFPGRDVESLTDEDLLREVMNTVGKPGKLGEQVRCVVSVSMLTEGWDANTVTHVLGIRAFGTQLLCEQVVGRACAG